MALPIDIARRAGANLGRAARRALAQAVLPRGAGVWLVIRLGPGLDEMAVPRLPFHREEGLSLLEVLETLESAADDPRIDGVLLRFSGTPAGWGKLLSLRRAVESVRERGLLVAVFSEALDGEALVVASAADRVWLPETGALHLVGLHLEGFFLRGLLDHLGVRPEVVRIGTHKSAADRFTRDSMTPEEREQLEALADDLYAELVQAIARGRGLDESAVRDLVDRGPYTARAAEEAGLIDGCLYPDEVEEELARLSPVPPPERDGARRAQLVEGAVYRALRGRDPGWRPLLRGLPRLAYVIARGAIHRGSGPRGIASDSLRQIFERLRRDESVRGVVLRIDSPGGDAVASDLLWRSISLVKREKPVVVSMGDVAASGGYYMAAAADAVVAEAGTVTGSIGVVGGKLNLEELYRRIGVGRDGVERGERAGILSEARGFAPDERKVVRDGMAAMYAAFLDRVADGRGLSMEALEPVAQGKVWSGARASQLGLVDALGGPLEALAEVRRRAGLRADERVQLDVLPRVPTLPSLRLLLRMLPGHGAWI